MRTLQIILIGFCTILVMGCSASKEFIADEPAAVLQMKIADSLEAATAIHEAAAAYSNVAKQYPTSSFYKKAVRKAAYLYSSPLIPVAEDSTSLQWFQVYASLPISNEEKANADLYISFLKRIITLQKGIENLAASLKKQNYELSSRSNQVRELEAQLEKTKQELNKLKDIDVKVYQRGTKK
jgi:TolA-binding protein